jgi:hypothetical protein
MSAISFISHSFAADPISFGDPLFSKQWALKNSGQIIYKSISDLERIKIAGIPGSDINWVDTNLIPTTKRELIVAVLDSGLDTGHPDLVGRIWFNDQLCTNAPNAKILPCNGFNFLDGNNNLADDVGHGTHVAGVIAAYRNSIGIAGAADPRIKIMPLKVLNSQVNGFVYNGKLITDVIADAMVFAIKNGAEVINLSLGWPKLIDTIKVRQAFQMAEERNVIVIAASGNNSKDLPTFPCAYENVVCVGAVDNRGELTDFSNHGSKVDIVAPGEYIISTIPRGIESRVLRIANYDVKRGSSQAAPFVTAAVATLKLLNPGLSNDLVRSLLFQSSEPLKQTTTNRFVKYGALNFKNLLEKIKSISEVAFVIPQLKDMTEIKFHSADKRFAFKLPLKNISTQNYSGKICLESSSTAIDFDQKCFDVLDLKGFGSTSIQVTGHLTDLSLDSHIQVSVRIDQKNYETSFVFSRDLNQDSELKSHVIQGGNFDDMGILNGERKISKMIRVIDKHHQINHPEYFYLEKAKQSATASVVSFLTAENGDYDYKVKSITLPVVNRVLSIHRQDINHDGVVDIFIYALSAKKDQLLFFNFDNKLNPLFGKYSQWSMALSTFEGLPIDGGVEKFEWTQITHPQLGSLIVPSIFRSYTMPEADNSKNILDRVTQNTNHQFYLNPKLQSTDDSMKIELRVLDTVNAMKKLRNDFHLYSNQTIQLLKPLPQTQAQSQNGEIHSLLSIETDGQKIYKEMILKSVGLISQDTSGIFGLESALVYPLINSTTGNLSSDFLFTSLLNRSGAEFLIQSHSTFSDPLILKQEWENPIIGVIGGFNKLEERAIFVENRSSLTLFKSNGERSDQPIYRDSSFPGQNFSETLMPILVQGLPGVYVNSTLIYGSRLYSMIDSNSGLIRPLQLSVVIPDGCVPLNPESLEEKTQFNYSFLCVDQNKQTSLKFLPLLGH